MLQTLKRRRDSIAQEYLHRRGGLDRFTVQDGRLTFHGLRARHGLAPGSVHRTITWHVYDNQQERVREELREGTSRDEAVRLPSNEVPPFLRATLETPQGGTTRVFVRRTLAPAASSLRRGVLYEGMGIERSGVAPTGLASE